MSTAPTAASMSESFYNLRRFKIQCDFKARAYYKVPQNEACFVQMFKREDYRYCLDGVIALVAKCMLCWNHKGAIWIVYAL